MHVTVVLDGELGNPPVELIEQLEKLAAQHAPVKMLEKILSHHGSVYADDLKVSEVHVRNTVDQRSATAKDLEDHWFANQTPGDLGVS